MHIPGFLALIGLETLYSQTGAEAELLNGMFLCKPEIAMFKNSRFRMCY